MMDGHEPGACSLLWNSEPQAESHLCELHASWPRPPRGQHLTPGPSEPEPRALPLLCGLTLAPGVGPGQGGPWKGYEKDVKV